MSRTAPPTSSPLDAQQRARGRRLAITSHGDILKCPSDFEKDEVLANVRDRSIKEVWDTEQEAERQRHLAGNRLVSIACRRRRYNG